jgi:hypothetical protein
MTAAALAGGVYWMSLQGASKCFRARRERLIGILEGRS